MSTQQFQVGRKYWTRSICDYDCIHEFQILARTAKTVTINHNGCNVRRGLAVRDDVEEFKPFGTYSMCAVIKADRVR